MYRIAIGADHRGYEIKQYLLHSGISDFQITWIDKGCYSKERTDYPPFAIAVAQEIIKKTADYGILLCGTGVGMTIAANRFEHIYAGLVWNVELARRAKEEDNINVLSLPADFMSKELVIEMLKAWLAASFKNGRYAKRIALIDQITKK